MKKIVLLLAVMLAGCAGDPVSEQGSTLRVISLAPAITETLFALGAGEMVVGVTRYCNYPVAAKELPKIGDFASADLESIVRLKPDLVIATTDGNPRETVEKLKSLDINVLTVGGTGFEDILNSTRAIGKAIGREDAARELADRLQEEWNLIGKRYEGREGPSVLLLVGVEPLVAAGEGSIGDELIEQAGGRNVFSDSGKAYVTTNHESIISLAPDIIMQSAMGSETDEQVRKDWSRWSSVPAVKNGKVYVMNQDLLNRPGPRIVEALRHVEKTMHGAEKKD
jgi:iron complex transport system substrate-binding protein